MNKGRTAYIIIFTLGAYAGYHLIDSSTIIQAWLEIPPRLTIPTLWWIANIGDLATTWYLFKKCGTGGELNPIVLIFTDRLGPTRGILLFKLVVLSTIFLLDLAAPNRILITLCTIIILICFCNNLVVIALYHRSRAKTENT